MEDDESCSICLEGLGSDSVSKLECGHSFHTECIMKCACLPVCPMCREEFDPLSMASNIVSDTIRRNLATYHSDLLFDELVSLIVRSKHNKNSIGNILSTIYNVNFTSNPRVETYFSRLSSFINQKNTCTCK